MRYLHESGWDRALARARRHVQCLGPRRNRNRGAGPGTSGALPDLQVSPAGAVLASGERCPGQAAAPIAAHNDTPVTRHGRRWGFAGRR